MLRRTLHLTTTILLALLFLGAAQAEIGNPETVLFARYPAPSPEGSTLAFSWAGNIWTVPITGGRATRLTSSEGYDHKPIWSPDAERIAFMSNRHGSEDLFVIDAKGGTPERITFASNNDLLSGWTPAGDSLIFSSRRGGPWPDHRAPHVIDLAASRGDGPGAPRKLVPCPGIGATMNPQGEIAAFEFGPGGGYRQGYRGPRKQDIWLYHPGSGSFTRITENDVYNTDPQWSADGSKLYFRSEAGGFGNLWMWDSATGELTEVTHVRSTGLWHPRIGGTAGSEVVAYEWRGGIYVQDLPRGNPREVHITAWLDEDPNAPETIIRSSGVTEYAISPDGDEMAIVVRGEIFCVRTDGIGGTDASRLTDHPARDWEIQWYPRGDAILFTSDRDGIEQLYRVSSDDPDHERLSESRRFKVERLTHSEDPCTRAIFAPMLDNDPPPAPADLTVGYVRNTGDLWLMDGDGHHQRLLFRHWGTLNFSFSPDGRWLAYDRQDDDYNLDIFIAAVDPSDPDLPPCPADGWAPFPGRSGAIDLMPSWANGEVNITRHPDDDYMPVWSPDGSKLGFTSQRWFDNVDAYFIFLRQSDEERSLEEWERQAEPLSALPATDSDSEEAGEENGEDKDEEDAELLVEIDFSDIHHRGRRLTSYPGREVLWAFSPDGETIAYSSDTDGTKDVWQISWTGEDEKALTNDASPEWITWAEEADRVFYLAGGRISSCAPEGSDSQAHGFNARMTVDPQEERMYRFEEAWRLQEIWFYDPTFHGRNWEALREEYLPIAAAARHYRDFNNAVNMMMGRLNSSHLYYSEGETFPAGPETGYPGWGLVEDTHIGLLVDWVTPRSPVDEEEAGIGVGDRIVSINGYDVGGWGGDPIANWWRALDDTVGREIEIGVIDADLNSRDPRWVRVIPATYWDWYSLEYEAWMADNRERVDELSGGTIGYTHVRRMYEGQLERFEQDLYTVGHGKDGMIIDVRWNSGGWVTDYLLVMLDTRRHALTQPRGGGLGYPEDRTPFYTTSLPIVAMGNEWSYSNAEIFCHAIQTLDRGLLVGWPTGGGVISTGGTMLADGSYVSLPRRGWWAIDSETGEILYNLEGNPAIPDVIVELSPSDIATGADPQLDAAVEALMSDLGMRR